MNCLEARGTLVNVAATRRGRESKKTFSANQWKRKHFVGCFFPPKEKEKREGSASSFSNRSFHEGRASTQSSTTGEKGGKGDEPLCPFFLLLKRTKKHHNRELFLPFRPLSFFTRGEMHLREKEGENHFLLSPLLGELHFCAKKKKCSPSFWRNFV